ncbi:hypothetical protein EO244_09940 [Ancylomarina salipaludis]|uniref:Uncharacterized protein n=1 Tax=Ancylomarina salipaludis TaxID=2501299 RepID=A0A4Q1JKR1_9BACT|nr:hypothetical protein [Ancylomarina salipaludis]RXQ93890.1 hypothetical protein EO244_09940 [Ancylomarina salipaludis]
MTSYTPHNTDFSIWKRIKSELSLFLIIQVIFLFFTGINLIYEITLVLIFILLLSLKRNRIIYQIDFDEEKNEFTISYFSLIAIKGTEIVPLTNLNTRLGPKRFGLGSSVTTLEFFNKKQLIGEIRSDDKWQWTDEQLDEIHKKVVDSKI